jgi:hypothetical protein
MTIKGMRGYIAQRQYVFEQQEKPHDILYNQDLEPPLETKEYYTLSSSGFTVFFRRNEHLPTVVKIAVNRVGAVKAVRCARCFTGSERWCFSFVVCATSALATFGVSPFWIWHNLFSLRLYV